MPPPTKCGSATTPANVTAIRSATPRCYALVVKRTRKQVGGDQAADGARSELVAPISRRVAARTLAGLVTTTYGKMALDHLVARHSFPLEIIRHAVWLSVRFHTQMWRCRRSAR